MSAGTRRTDVSDDFLRWSTFLTLALCLAMIGVGIAGSWTHLADMDPACQHIATPHYPTR